MDKKIVIIGGGPTGLGAAYRLYELGYENWKIYEKEDYLGGCSASFVDEKGFVWDVGGHVIFSHYPYFDRMLERLLGNDYLEHMRESWIRIKGTWVPYPFQNNIGRLPKEALLECLIELIESDRKGKTDSALTFRDWIEASFGRGIAKYFMFPYNYKVWATPLELMDKNWVAERVSPVNIQRVLENVILSKDDISWGPNNKFRFPLYGGTGEIYRRVEPYVEKHLAYNKELTEVDINKKELRFRDGTVDSYDELINTAPLDIFCRNLKPGIPGIAENASLLEHNSVLIVGIGLEKRLDDKKCWMYFPEDNAPFYRVTYFSNYSPNNVPGGDITRYCSMMCETSYSPYKREDKATIVERTVQGLINSGLLNDEDRSSVVSTFVKDVGYAYPIPTLKRDDALRTIQPFLEKHGIYSRGRFGGWKYEVGNMDHSVMQGVEIVDRILTGKDETVYRVAS